MGRGAGDPQRRVEPPGIDLPQPLGLLHVQGVGDENDPRSRFELSVEFCGNGAEQVLWEKRGIGEHHVVWGPVRLEKVTCPELGGPCIRAGNKR